MPRKKQHCPKRMKCKYHGIGPPKPKNPEILAEERPKSKIKIEGEGAEGEGPPRSPSQQQSNIDTASSNEEGSDQSQDEEEEEGQSGATQVAPPDGDSENEQAPSAGAVISREEIGAEGKPSEEVKQEANKVLNLNKSSETERMLGPEALIARDPSSPRGTSTVSQPPSPSPSPPSPSPSLPTPILATPQLQPILELARPHVIPPPTHHQPIPIHPAAMLGPAAAAILPPSAAILSPPSAVILNPTTAAMLGNSPVLSARPVETGNAEILDFSTKGRKRGRRRDGGRESGDEGDSEDEMESDVDQDSIEEEGGVLNLSKPTTPQLTTLDLSSPLDLSVNRRKRQRLASSDEVPIATAQTVASQTPQNLHVGATTVPTSMSPLASLASSIATHLLPHRRSQPGRSEQFKQPPTPWSTGSNQVPPSQNLPYPFYQTKGTQHHHHHQSQQQSPQHQSNALRQSSPDPWNGKVKGNVATSPGYNLSASVAPSDATKALEKMSELSKLGSDSVREDAATLSYLRQHQGGSVSSRQSAWQSHWLSKGAEQARDVLKCVWCRQSFQSLSALTVHMKEAKHCGVQGMPQGQTPTSVAISTSQTTQQQPSTVQSTSSISNSTGNPGSSNSAAQTQQGKDLSLLIKETMPLPRKLVRGQDVWLGKGAEQTRQILKCMWCGQSFRSLAEMTSHMQQTQHYTNIVSQEQIISWKSADDRGGGGAGGGGASGAANSATSGTGGASGNTGSQGGHVSAVLTCKVCDEAFGSLKELSNHMVKNAHYKEHIMRSITEGGAAGQMGNSQAQARRRGGSGSGNSPSAIAAREKRKKSLPVRKLLELERAQNELKNGGSGDVGKSGNMAMLTNPGGGRITCEKCGERIETAMFVEHIRQCVGGSVASLNQQRNLLKSALMSEVQEAANLSAAARNEGTALPPPQRPQQVKLPTPDKNDNSSSKSDQVGGGGGGPGSSPSVLNAIEKLIEKSFDSRMRQGYAGGISGGPGNVTPGMQPIGSSILKRLGIDESVDYTKPLVDQHTMNLLRGYHAYGQFGGLLNPGVGPTGVAAKRERSGSESSSVSDRCGGGGSVTPPDRRQKSITPRSTPEALQSPPVSTPVSSNLVNSTPPTSQPATPLQEEKRERKEDPSSEEEGEGGGESSVGGGEREGEEVGGEVEGREEKEGEAPEKEIKKEMEEKDSSNEADGEDEPCEEPEDLQAKSPREEERSEKDEKPPKQIKSEEKSQKQETAKSEREERTKTDIKQEEDTEKEEEVSKGSPKAAGSLGALSSMFDSLSGDAPSSSQTASSNAGGGGTTSHPLAALQKLCDKTESHHNHGGSHQNVHARSPSVGSTSSTLNANYPSSSNTSPSNPGAILAFSWACNDAVVSDSLLKCAFCETPFVSKGAYRHHLSKMHFVKDGVLPESSSSQTQAGPGSQEMNSQGRNEVTSPKSVPPPSGGEGRSPQVSTTPPGTSSSDESPHSKFLKYTELAKQLSSKYV